MAHIERPAIAGMWPTMRGESIVLDVGATIGADAGHLVDIAIMGSAMARIVFDLDRPTVGLLNVGAEEIKGIEAVKEAGPDPARGRTCPHLEYRGFVEGDDLGKGTVDVVVTEGFTGNIALKTAEGTAKQIARVSALRHEPHPDGEDRLSVRASRPSTRCGTRWTRARSMAASSSGSKGWSIKSHGGTDALGFASAIDVAYDMAQYELDERRSATCSSMTRCAPSRR